MPLPSESSPQLLYNTTSGALYFDQDGAGSTHAVLQIATIVGQKPLAAADLVVA